MHLRSFMALTAFFVFSTTAASAQDPAAASVPESAPAVYQPDPLSQRMTAADVLEGTQGYVHPFLSLGEFYTDNLFNTPDDKESEWITIISPGIWVSVPASRQPTLDMETVNTAPGGMQLSTLRRDPERRFQGYGLYRADFRKHAENSEEETDTHRAEGQLYYRLRGGLAFELIDIFQLDQDPYNTGDETSLEDRRELDEFTSNLLRLAGYYPVTPKLGFEFSYGLYNLDYDADRNNYRDRDDQTATASAYFRFLPKTSLVLDYQFIDIEYDNARERDSREHRYMGGVQWDMTARSVARLLLGYGDKNFDDRSDRGDFIAEARFDYSPSEKTKAFVRAVRRSNESDVRDAADIFTHQIQAGVAQRLSARWSAAVDAYFNNEDYRGADREDDLYGASLTLGYAFRRWLNFGFGYSYVTRDSNAPGFDYDTNSVFATVSASL